VRKWWNWQTHHLEGVAPKGVGVQIPPSAPLHSLLILGPVNSMIILVTVIHVIVCLFLIIVVLLQSGKAGDISAAFGGQGSQAAFGPRGAATTLSRATTVSAVLFMLTSITLSINAIKQGGPKSVLQGVKSAPAKTQPAAPAQKPATPPTQK
jgi:preprotein translocase subunit SecG